MPHSYQIVRFMQQSNLLCTYAVQRDWTAWFKPTLDQEKYIGQDGKVSLESGDLEHRQEGLVKSRFTPHHEPTAPQHPFAISTNRAHASVHILLTLSRYHTTLSENEEVSATTNNTHTISERIRISTTCSSPAKVEY